MTQTSNCITKTSFEVIPSTHADLTGGAPSVTDAAPASTTSDSSNSGNAIGGSVSSQASMFWTTLVDALGNVRTTLVPAQPAAAAANNAQQPPPAVSASAPTSEQGTIVNGVFSRLLGSVMPFFNPSGLPVSTHGPPSTTGSAPPPAVQTNEAIDLGNPNSGLPPPMTTQASGSGVQ
jgi:hypothetical protein